MKLRGKLFSILGVSYLFISIAIIVSSNTILIKGFIEQENEDITAQLDLAVHSLELRLSSLDHTTLELSSNDNVYMYMQSGMQHLVNDYLLSSSLINREINFMVFVNQNGDIELSRAFDLLELKNMELPEDINNLITSDSLIDGSEDGRYGLIATDFGFLMLSYYPILTTEGNGPSMGTIICGRFLDVAEIGLLAESTSVDLQIMTGTESGVDTPFADSTLITRPGSDLITAYRTIEDINGKNNVVLKVNSDRDYFNQAELMLATFIGSSVITGLVIGLVAIIATNKFILEKIIRLSAEVKSINPHALDERRVQIQGQDEISELSTDIDRMIEALAEYQQLLKEKERMATIGETAAMVGHDLRNPLQVVILISSRLSKLTQRLTDMGLGEKTIKELTMIENKLRDQAGYMNKIVSDLQDFSRNIRLNVRESDLQGMVHEVLDSIAIPDNIKVGRNLDNSLGEVYADENYLRRVFNNLINNAIQAMPLGGLLEVKGEVSNDVASFTVIDTGNGIKEEDKGRIFTPLFTTKAKGTGLGLAVCKRIITAHKGKIWFESEVGVGTKFMVSFPASKREPLGTGTQSR